MKRTISMGRRSSSAAKRKSGGEHAGTQDRFPEDSYARAKAKNDGGSWDPSRYEAPIQAGTENGSNMSHGVRSATNEPVPATNPDELPEHPEPQGRTVYLTNVPDHASSSGAPSSSSRGGRLFGFDEQYPRSSPEPDVALGIIRMDRHFTPYVEPMPVRMVSESGRPVFYASPDGYTLSSENITSLDANTRREAGTALGHSKNVLQTRPASEREHLSKIDVTPPARPRAPVHDPQVESSRNQKLLSRRNGRPDLKKEYQQQEESQREQQPIAPPRGMPAGMNFAHPIGNDSMSGFTGHSGHLTGMYNKETLEKILTTMGNYLMSRKQNFSIVAHGGLINCLALQSRLTTRDVDWLIPQCDDLQDIEWKAALFATCAAHDLPVKFFKDHAMVNIQENLLETIVEEALNCRRLVFEHGGLHIYAAPFSFMLAAKIDRTGRGKEQSRPYDLEDAVAYLFEFLKQRHSAGQPVKYRWIRHLCNLYQALGWMPQKERDRKCLKLAWEINQMFKNRHGYDGITELSGYEAVEVHET